MQSQLPIEGIEDYIRELYEQYTLSATCTLVCVLPATEDLGTQLARGWCKEWDPLGLRSLGVLTKVDLPPFEQLRDRIMGKGKNVANFKHGTIALMNPSGEVVESSPDLSKRANEEEALFFQTFAAKIAGKDEDRLKGRLGIDSLISSLVKIQSESLSGKVPKLREDVQKMINTTEKQLKSLPAPVTKDQSLGIAFKVISDLRDTFCLFEDADQSTNRDNHTYARISEMTGDFHLSVHNASTNLLTPEMYEEASDILDTAKGALIDLLNYKVFPVVDAAENIKLEGPAELVIDQVYQYLYDRA